jgi:hypothetical protein
MILLSHTQTHEHSLSHTSLTPPLFSSFHSSIPHFFSFVPSLTPFSLFSPDLLLPPHHSPSPSCFRYHPLPHSISHPCPASFSFQSFDYSRVPGGLAAVGMGGGPGVMGAGGVASSYDSANMSSGGRGARGVQRRCVVSHTVCVSWCVSVCVCVCMCVCVCVCVYG